MSKVKGCINKSCVAYNNKIPFKKDDNYCSKCGQELVFVCKRCYEPVENINNKYCYRCEEEIRVRNEKIKANAKKVATKGKDAAVAAVKVVPAIASTLNIPKVQEVMKKSPIPDKVIDKAKDAILVADDVIKKVKK